MVTDMSDMKCAVPVTLALNFVLHAGCDSMTFLEVLPWKPDA